jgi:hypothetical protein
LDNISLGISTQTPKKNTLNDALQELLDTQFFQQIAHRNGSPFAEALAKWLIQYTLVAASMNEAFDLNLELILYTLHVNKLSV